MNINITFDLVIFKKNVLCNYLCFSFCNYVIVILLNNTLS